jgi:hypothetical protein
VTERIRLGAIVRLPDNAVYGTYAIVVKVAPQYLTTATRGMELTYHRDQLEYYGTITRGRTYGSLSGNRFAVCTFTTADGTTREVHVKTRDGHTGGEETRALEIRKLAFVQLMKDLR